MNLDDIVDKIVSELIVARRAHELRKEEFKLSVQGKPVMRRVLAECEFRPRKTRRATDPKPRARDAVFDLLCRLDRLDQTQLTRLAASRIAGAKKQILEVMPGSSIVEVNAEIERRWRVYCGRYPDRKMQTVMALVKHWAQLGGGERTRASLTDIYQEPPGDWRAAAAEVLGIHPELLAERAFLDLSPDNRKATLEFMLRQRGEVRT